jgi:hypothetical protein
MGTHACGEKGVGRPPSELILQAVDCPLMLERRVVHGWMGWGECHPRPKTLTWSAELLSAEKRRFSVSGATGVG